MSKEGASFVASVKSLLRYHEVIDLKLYPRNDDVASFLGAAAETSGCSGCASAAPSPVAQGASRVQESSRSSVKPAEIAEEVAVCRACDLHSKRIYPVAGRGGDSARLLLVGDWLASDTAGNLEPGHLFGVQQDIMLSRMFDAINLSPGDVFVTNVIKCAIPATLQPQASHVESCVSYLRRQIVALMPEVICTMGMIAARAVLERRQPLSRLRGQFHNYEAGEDKKIPVIATYHPTYLLQNPEMKHAAWADLQLLAKRMGTIS